MEENNKKISFVDCICNSLKENAGAQFTAKELAEQYIKNYPERAETKRQNSAQDLSQQNTLRAQIASEIGANIKNFEKRGIQTTAERPRSYFYPNETNLQNEEKFEKLKEKIQEKDLYPKLNEYLWREFKIYPKRINEKTSTNIRGKNGNRWIHPDIVALEHLGEKWDNNVKNLAQNTCARMIKIYSFEVKIKLDFSNVRESFFQAVSNSSWANCGYLVAAEINNNILQELQILNKLHGIGIIRLNKDLPGESQIILPANENEEIDWDGANRIASVNTDFEDFIQKCNDSFKTTIRLGEWDIPAHALD